MAMSVVMRRVASPPLKSSDVFYKRVSSFILCFVRNFGCKRLFLENVKQ